MKKCLFILIVFILAFNSKIEAQKTAIIPLGSSLNWSSLNWTPINIPPASGEAATIKFSGTGSLTINQPITVGSLTINNLTGNGTLRGTVTSNNSITTITNTGTNPTNGNITIGKAVDFVLGTTFNNNTSIVNCSGNIIVAGATLTATVPFPTATRPYDGAGLYCNANKLTANTFTLGDFSFLGLGDPMGLDGNILATINLPQTGNYIYNYLYNGSLDQPQYSGTLPSTVNDITINNVSPPALPLANDRVILISDLIVKGKNNLIQGVFDIVVNKITYDGLGVMNVTSGKLKADNEFAKVEMRGTEISTPQNLSSTWFVNNTIGTLINSNKTGIVIASSSTSPAPPTPLLIKTSLLYGQDASGADINSSYIATNDNLTLLSTITSTANFGKVINGNSITGKVSIERFLLARNAWRFLATPVDIATSPTITESWREGGAWVSTLLGSIANGYGTRLSGPIGPFIASQSQPTIIAPQTIFNNLDDYSLRTSMKSYNMTNNTFTDVTGTDIQNNKKIANEEGYMLFVRGDRTVPTVLNPPTNNTVLRIKGNIRTGPQNFNVVAGRFRSVGNPFPSRINFKSVLKNNIQDAYTAWTPFKPGIYNVGAFQTYYYDYNAFDFNNPLDPNPFFGEYTSSNPATPLTPPTEFLVKNEIESGEAVYIQNVLPANGPLGSLTIQENDKKEGSRNVSRPPFNDPIIPRYARTTALKVMLYSNNLAGANPSAIDPTTNMHFADGLVVNFNDVFNQGVDNDDVSKYTNTYDNISTKEGTSLLEANRRPFIRNFDTVFLNMGALREATYRFDIINNFIATYPRTLSVILKDKYINTETIINLRGGNTTTYAFRITTDILSKAADRFMIVFRNPPVLATSVMANNTNSFMRSSSSTTLETVTDNTFNKTTKSLIETIASTEKLISINPTVIANGQVNLLLQNQQLGAYQLQVINQQGQLIKTESIQVKTNTSTHILQIGNAAKGSYKVCITNMAGKKTTIGFIVN